MLSELSRQVAYRLRQNNFNAGGVQIAVKDTDLTVKQYQTPIKPTHSGKALAEAGFKLFRKRYDWEKDVRALTIRAISLLPDSDPIQLDLSYNHNRFVKNRYFRTNYRQHKRQIRQKLGPSRKDADGYKTAGAS